MNKNQKLNFTQKLIKDVIESKHNKLFQVIQKKKEFNKTDRQINLIIKYIEKNTFDENRINTSNQGNGILTQENGINILKLTGTPVEMGFQHGYLLAGQIQKPRENCQVPLNRFWSNYVDNLIADLIKGKSFFSKILIKLAKTILAPWCEEATIAERITEKNFCSLVGLYEGYLYRMSSLGRDDEKLLKLFEFVRGYIQPDVVNVLLENSLGTSVPFQIIKDLGLMWPQVPVGRMGCTTIGVDQDITKNKDMMLACDFDYDPVAGIWENNLTLIHFNTKKESKSANNKKLVGNDGLSYLTLTTAGSHTGGLMGVNEKGVVFRVNNNFTKMTDRKFKKKRAHGQPLLNFGQFILQYGDNLSSDNTLKDLVEKIKTDIKNIPVNLISDSTPSGWTFAVGQTKKTGFGKMFMMETNFQKKSLVSIPCKYDSGNQKHINRFALIADIFKKEKNEAIKAIWQTNFYTDPDMRKDDIFWKRSKQLDKLNRYFRTGESLRDSLIRRKTNGGFELCWKDLANILADNKNVFTGNHQRINVGSIASLSNVTTVIFSVTPEASENNPKIKVYLTCPGKNYTSGEETKEGKFVMTTPTAWWPYYDLAFDDFNKKTVKKYLHDTGFCSGVVEASFKNAMFLYYQAYMESTFKAKEEIDYSKIIKYFKDMVKEFKKPLKIDPFIYFQIGRAFCLWAKKIHKNAPYKKTEIINLFNSAVEMLKKCIDVQIGEITDIYDAHLINSSRLYLVRIGKLAEFRIEVQGLDKIIDDLKNATLFYQINFENSPGLKDAITPFLDKKYINTGNRLIYQKDEKLRDSAHRLTKKCKKFKIKKFEEKIDFDGPDPMFYSYQIPF